MLYFLNGYIFVPANIRIFYCSRFF